LTNNNVIESAGKLPKMEEVILKCRDEEFIIDSLKLTTSEYFKVCQNGSFRKTYKDQKNLIVIPDQWYDQLSLYIDYKKDDLLNRRITGDDFSFGKYIIDEEYIELCRKHPKVSNKAKKFFMRNTKTKSLWAKLSSKTAERQLYFSEFSDNELDQLIKNWPTKLSFVDIAREFYHRHRDYNLLPTMFQRTPSTIQLKPMEISPLWAFWINNRYSMMSLDDELQKLTLYNIPQNLITREEQEFVKVLQCKYNLL
jgi:hypothetical protein